MASDAKMISGINLPGEFVIPSGRTSEKIEQLKARRKPIDFAPQVAEDSELTDEKMVMLLMVGNQGALDVLFDRHSRLVYSIALRILRDQGEAEEVVQECFLYIYRKANLFDATRGSVKVWVVQIAYSRSLDRKDRLARSGFYLHSDIDSVLLHDALPLRGDMEREVEARLDFGRLRSSFEDLTEIQQETLKLFYFEGMDLREISERLQEPLGNIRHHFYRGLERLRKSAGVERQRKQQNGKI